MTYNMPPDTSAKEKIIGGLLDFSQLLYILVGIGAGILLGQFFKLFLGEAGMIVGLIPGIIFAALFCFVKIKGLSLMQYIKFKQKHKKKTKLLPNLRIDGLDKDDINKIRNYKI